MSWSSSLDSRLSKITFDCSGMPSTSFLYQIGRCYVSLLPILGSKKLSGTQMTLISTERIDRFKGFDTKPIICAKGNICTKKPQKCEPQEFIFDKERQYCVLWKLLSFMIHLSHFVFASCNPRNPLPASSFPKTLMFPTFAYPFRTSLTPKTFPYRTFLTPTNLSLPINAFLSIVSLFYLDFCCSA